MTSLTILLQFPERYSSCLSSFLAFWHWCVWAFFSGHLFSLGVSQLWWLSSGGSTPSDKGGGGEGGSWSSRPWDKGEGGSRKNFFLFGLKIRGTPPLDLPLLSQFIAFPPPLSPVPFHISTDLLSVASACFLPLHTGAHDWVTRICQPWEWSLSRSLLPRERRSVTSYFHGSKISGSQQQGALAMTMATATKTAKKNTGRFILAKQQLWTCIMIFGTFLYSYCSTIIATWNYLISSAGFMEKVNKTQKCSFSFTKLWYSPFGFNSRKFLQTFDKFNETK